jgi:hypothetical protein
MLAYSTTEKIRRLNDTFRRSLVFGGRVLLTQGVAALADQDKNALLCKVQAFDSFTADNDPHGEHDFGAVEQDGVRYFWKIDYYDLANEFASADAANPAVTNRVLTVMRADEY